MLELHKASEHRVLDV